MLHFITIAGLIALSRSMKPSRSLGDISSGMELFKIFLSQNLMDMRFVERAAAERIPLDFLTSVILSIGNHSHL